MVNGVDELQRLCRGLFSYSAKNVDNVWKNVPLLTG